MKSYTVAAVAALISTSYAATVTLETTRCINVDISTEQFNIELNAEEPVAKNLPSVCGLRILSASGINVYNIICQAFHDAAGTQPGSAPFTFDSPALIATNPVQEQSILCSTINSDLVRRQNNSPNNSTASVASSISRSLSRTASIPRSTVVGTSTVSENEISNTTSSVAPSTIISTVHVSASPTSSGNGTVPSNTGRPTATQTNTNPGDTGAASAFGVSVGLIAVAFAALLL